MRRCGRGSLGRDPEEPAVVALPFRRPGYGAAGEGARADLPRPLLERVLGRSEELRRSLTPALRQALPPSGGDAFRLRAVQGLRLLGHRGFPAMTARRHGTLREGALLG